MEIISGLSNVPRGLTVAVTGEPAQELIDDWSALGRGLVENFVVMARVYLECSVWCSKSLEKQLGVTHIGNVVVTAGEHQAGQTHLGCLLPGQELGLAGFGKPARGRILV